MNNRRKVHLSKKRAKNYFGMLDVCLNWGKCSSVNVLLELDIVSGRSLNKKGPDCLYEHQLTV